MAEVGVQDGGKSRKKEARKKINRAQKHQQRESLERIPDGEQVVKFAHRYTTAAKAHAQLGGWQ